MKCYAMHVAKMPIKCPTCNDILESTYSSLPNGRDAFIKKCYKKIDHQITFRAFDNNHDYIESVSIPWGNDSVVIWYYYSGTILFNTSSGTEWHIPFFEPNFSNLKKLKEKIKTYLIFT